MGETMAAQALQSNEDLGKLIIRVTVGVLIVFHGLAVLTGDPGIPNRLAAWGLPEQLKWLVFFAEFFGGLMMIVGAYARVGGFLVGLFMVAQNPGGNHWDHYFLDTQMFYLLGGFSVFFLGAGKYGLNMGGEWN